MSGEGVTSMVVGHGRGVALGGAPTGRDSWVEQRFDSARPAADERARVVAYMHRMADEAVRLEETAIVGAAAAPSIATMLREIAANVEAGKHWHG